MGWLWLTRKGNYILKSNLPIGIQNITLKSVDDHMVYGLVFWNPTMRGNAD